MKILSKKIILKHLQTGVPPPQNALEHYKDVRERESKNK